MLGISIGRTYFENIRNHLIDNGLTEDFMAILKKCLNEKPKW